MITIGIVDDETLARENLRLILENYCPEAAVVGMAGLIEEAQQLLREQRPQLLFLDIELQDGNGFDLMQHISPLETKVVFVSAHLDRGVETYEHGALYYMGKPIRILEVKRAVELCKEAIATAELKARFNSSKPSPREDILSVPEPDGFRILTLDHILYVSAMRNCCTVKLQDQTSVIISRSIKEIGDLLPYPEFLRTHRSYLVNCRHVTKVSKGKRGYIHLHNGSQIPMSKEYFDDIRIHLLRQVD